jgi:hypothetical protein
MKRLRDLENVMPSPLAMDLAVSRLSLAALRALSNEEPSTQERLQAKELQEALALELAHLRDTNPISPDVVPTDTMRNELQQTLGMLPEVHTAFNREDIANLAELVQLLGNLEAGHVVPEEAGKLLSALLRVRAQPVAAPLKPEPFVGLNGTAE